MRKIRIRRRRDVELSRQEVEYLLSGFRRFGATIPPEKIAGAWESISVQVMDHWTRERPGTRPWAWWLCESPEPRMRLDGTRESEPYRYGKGDQAAIDYGIDELVAYRKTVVNGNKFMEPFSLIRTDTHETEERYLRRLNLLTPHEVEFLSKNRPAESQDVLGGIAPSCGFGVFRISRDYTCKTASGAPELKNT